ncbi:MAG: FAD-dependent oxidoreductase, partial [Oscillospiraceae bacterium]|nr:FAD-dependent oxidoreductase [Oscillospiraceae bacterium]
AIGSVPQSEVFKGLVSLDEDGYILTDECMRTDRPGIFAAGDIRATPLRQIVTSLSDGAVAAYYATQYVLSLT